MGLADFYAASRVTSTFPRYSDGSPHYGVDFAHPTGTEIPTPWPVTVVRADKQSAHGWFVVGRRPDGMFVSWSHMAWDPEYSPGDTIGRGGSVGRVGSTGLSTGPHAHVQISRSTQPWVHGTEIDPWPEIQAALGGFAAGGSAPFTTESEEDDMAQPAQVHWDVAGGRIQRALFVPGTAYWMTWTEGGSDIANGFAANVPTRSSTKIDASVAGAMKAAADALLPKPPEVSLDLDGLKVTAQADPEVRRLLAELLAAVAAPRTTTVA